MAAIAVIVIVALAVVFTRGEPAPLAESTPAGVVQRYAAAVIAGDEAAASAYLTPAARNKCTTEARPAARNLRVTLVSTTERPESADVRVLITVSEPGGPFGSAEYQVEDVFDLVRSGNGWLIDTAPWQLTVCPGRGEAMSAAKRTVRRLITYALLFALVVTAAVGLSGLLGRLLVAGTELASDDVAGLARSLAFALIGGPLAALLWWAVWRRLDDPEERSAIGWGLYVAGVYVLALLIATTNVLNTLSSLIGGQGPAVAAVPGHRTGVGCGLGLAPVDVASPPEESDRPGRRPHGARLGAGARAGRGRRRLSLIHPAGCRPAGSRD